MPIDGGRDPIQCTATIGVSHGFASVHGFDHAMQQADVALYLGKAAGRNRVVQSGDTDSTTTATRANGSPAMA